MNTYLYTYHDYDQDVRNLAEGINKQYDCIVGLSRGGLIAGVHLSHLLKIPFYPISWNRDGENFTFPVGKSILVVDDICDSGETLKQVTKQYGKMAAVDTATLIYNTAQDFTPTYYSMIIDRNVFTQWIEFWWEK